MAKTLKGQLIYGTNMYESMEKIRNEQYDIQLRKKVSKVRQR